MMACDALEPLGKLFAELFRELGWIAKILVIDVYVLRYDRFYPTTDPVGRFPLREPNGPEQFIDMAWLDLRYRELTDRGVSVPLERGRPLVAVFFAPGIPTIIDIGLRTFFKDLRLLGFNNSPSALRRPNAFPGQGRRRHGPSRGLRRGQAVPPSTRRP